MYVCKETDECCEHIKLCSEGGFFIYKTVSSLVNEYINVYEMFYVCLFLFDGNITHPRTETEVANRRQGGAERRWNTNKSDDDDDDDVADRSNETASV